VACICQDRSAAENEEGTENCLREEWPEGQGNFLDPDHCRPHEGASAPDPLVHRSQIQWVRRSVESLMDCELSHRP